MMLDSLITVTDNNCKSDSADQREKSIEVETQAQQTPFGICPTDPQAYEPPSFSTSLPTPDETLKHLSFFQSQIIAICQEYDRGGDQTSLLKRSIQTMTQVEELIVASTMKQRNLEKKLAQRERQISELEIKYAWLEDDAPSQIDMQATCDEERQTAGEEMSDTAKSIKFGFRRLKTKALEHCRGKSINRENSFTTEFSSDEAKPEVSPQRLETLTSQELPCTMLLTATAEVPEIEHNEISIQNQEQNLEVVFGGLSPENLQTETLAFEREDTAQESMVVGSQEQLSEVRAATTATPPNEQSAPFARQVTIKLDKEKLEGLLSSRDNPQIFRYMLEQLSQAQVDEPEPEVKTETVVSPQIIEEQSSLKASTIIEEPVISESFDIPIPKKKTRKPRRRLFAAEPPEVPYPVHDCLGVLNHKGCGGHQRTKSASKVAAKDTGQVSRDLEFKVPAARSRSGYRRQPSQREINCDYQHNNI